MFEWGDGNGIYNRWHYMHPRVELAINTLAICIKVGTQYDQFGPADNARHCRKLANISYIKAYMLISL